MDEMEELFGETADGLFAVDQNQRIVLWTAAAETLTGIKARDALGHPCHILEGRDEWGESICTKDCHIFQALRQGQPPPSDDLIVRRPDGRQVRMTFSVIPLQKGSAQAIIIFRENRLRGWQEIVDRATAQLPTPPPTAALHVRLLGPLSLILQGCSLDSPPLTRPKVQKALKYLLAHYDRKVPKEVLMEFLWPEEDEEMGYRNLRVLVHTLKGALEPHRPPHQPSHFIGQEGGCYFFRMDAGVWIDVDAFQKHLREGEEAEKQGSPAQAIIHYEAAASLYRGEYLEEDLYEDWCAAERERLKELYISLLTKLSAFYAAAGHYEGAIDRLRQALAKDPCRESLHRNLMRYLWWAGQDTEALRQYEACRRSLAEELGIAPLPETTRLYQRIAQDLGDRRP